MDKYFDIHDTTKIDSFLSIPKILFSDSRFKKLTINAKMIYSLYLNRYSITQYKDEIGPYIVYNDSDITTKLHINRSTCSRARSELIKVGLIDTKRSVGNNKIYLYNYNNVNLDKTFFYEEDLKNYQFYRFPTEFFNETYMNLDLKTKLVYTIYFDTMCLSQMNYFVDDKERIYFQESGNIQEQKIGVTKNTIKECKTILKICGLLLEYKPFSQDSRFYLLKLNNFKDRTQSYINLSKEDKKTFIKEIDDLMKEELILKPIKRNSTVIKRKREDLKLTQADLVQIINENLNLSMPLSTYKNYETGRRNFPEKLYEFLLKYMDSLNRKIETKETKEETTGVIKSQNENKTIEEDSLIQNYDTYEDKSIAILEPTITKKKNKQNKNIDTNIINTENNYIYNNKTNILLINLINNINTFTYNSILLDSEQKDYLEAAFEKIRTFQKFYISKKELLLDGETIIHLFSKIDNQVTFERIIQKILTTIENNDYIFATPDNQINCFLTFLFNELQNLKNDDMVPSWFNKKSTKFDYMKNNESTPSDVDKEIKDYKWWDE